MISSGTGLSTGQSLLSYLNAQTSQNTGSADTNAASTTAAATANAKARSSATSQAALTAAGSTHQASVAGRALDKQQATLATDLRAAMATAGVKLSGPIEFSVGSDGSVGIKASDADKAATTAFLKADTTRPNFATRVATLARDALKQSATIQQNAAISQAARYAGKSGGVMSLYASLMQQSNATPAVFTLGATSSSLTYAGVLATKA